MKYSVRDTVFKNAAADGKVEVAASPNRERRKWRIPVLGNHRLESIPWAAESQDIRSK
jgi:hypothetical protein